MSAVSPEKRPEGFPGQRLILIPPHIAVRAGRQPVTRNLCVTHIGSFSAASGHFVERPHGTSQHILIACLSGIGHGSLLGREWRVKPGDLLFLPPREHHRYGADPRTPWTIFWLHFRGEQAGDYLDALGVTPAQPLVSVHPIATLAEAFEDTIRHANHGFGDAAMMGLSTAFARLLGLAKIHQQSAGKRSIGTEGRLLKTLTLVRESLAAPWTLETMARESGLGIAHFTELCRRQTGMPPVSYLIRLRLQRAMDLLLQGKHNVSEAARAVGYEDPFYFSRLFRKHMGTPPSRLRDGP